MKKTTVFLATMCTVLLAISTVWALPTTYNGNTQNEPGLDQSKNLGYYVWSNEDQTEWHLRWTGGSKNNRLKFQGQIFLSGSDSELSSNTMETSLYSFEKKDKFTQSSNSSIEFKTKAGRGKDGIDFSITGDPLTSGFICFDLNITGLTKSKTVTPLNFYSLIYLGEQMGNPTSNEFKVAFNAPDNDAEPVHTPEPTTILLLGSGLIGIAGFGRKKFAAKK